MTNLGGLYNDEPFWEPASVEDELKKQLEGLTISLDGLLQAKVFLQKYILSQCYAYFPVSWVVVSLVW